MNFLIVTGLSGAGKSMAVNALEDIGFFCIDNIPVALLPRIVDFALQGENQLNRVAVVMDVRGVRSIQKLHAAQKQHDNDSGRITRHINSRDECLCNDNDTVYNGNGRHNSPTKCCDLQRYGRK